MPRLIICSWVLACMLLGCSENILNELEAGTVVADTLDIAIVRDETPGFPYPIMRHDIHFVGFLSVPGVITGYGYKSQDVEFNSIYDYFLADNLPAAGTKNHFKTVRWSLSLLSVGTSVAYDFAAYASHAQSLTRSAEQQIRVVRDGPQPAQNSIQLTGPEDRNFQPMFSKDGQWIYYRGWDRDGRISTISRIPVSGGFAEKIVESTVDIGGFTLVQGDSVLMFIESDFQDKSTLVKHTIGMGEELRVALDGFIWDAPVVSISDTRYLVSQANPNVTNTDLVRIDTETGEVKTLFTEQETRAIFHYSHRPGTSKISVVTGTYEHPEVILLDHESSEEDVFLEEFSGIELVWMPDGRDYVAVKWGDTIGLDEQNIYLHTSGIERQLTFYPGHEGDIAVSSDGQNIAYCAFRRGEIQVWTLSL